MYGIQVKRRIQDSKSEDYIDEWHWLQSVSSRDINQWRNEHLARNYGESIYGNTVIEWRVQALPGNLNEEGDTERHQGSVFETDD